MPVNHKPFRNFPVSSPESAVRLFEGGRNPDSTFAVFVTRAEEEQRDATWHYPEPGPSFCLFGPGEQASLRTRENFEHKIFQLVGLQVGRHWRTRPHILRAFFWSGRAGQQDLLLPEESTWCSVTHVAGNGINLQTRCPGHSISPAPEVYYMYVVPLGQPWL